MKNLLILLLISFLQFLWFVSSGQNDSFLNNAKTDASLNSTTIPKYNYKKDIVVYYKTNDLAVIANIPVTKTDITYSVIVRDLLGNNILSTSVFRSAGDNSSETIPVRKLNAGIYFVNVYNEQEALTGKFVVNR